MYQGNEMGGNNNRQVIPSKEKFSWCLLHIWKVKIKQSLRKLVVQVSSPNKTVDGHFGCYLFCLNLSEKGKYV